MFEFNLNNNELEALDSLLTVCVDREESSLPAWNYMGQNIWEMDFDQESPASISEWFIETADVA